MRGHRWLLAPAFALGVAALTLVVAGCRSREEVRIGIVVSDEGVAGARLATIEINATGGIQGRPHGRRRASGAARLARTFEATARTPSRASAGDPRASDSGQRRDQRCRHGAQRGRGVPQHGECPAVGRSGKRVGVVVVPLHQDAGEMLLRAEVEGDLGARRNQTGGETGLPRSRPRLPPARRSAAQGA